MIEASVSEAPYLNMYPPGKLDNNMGATFRASVQERTSLAGSLVNPTFTADNQMCGTIPPADRSGTKEFTLALGTFKGRSNQICIRQARQAFLTAYSRETSAMKDGIKRLVNAEGRAQALLYGGTKAVASSTGMISQVLTGGELAIGTPFEGAYAPDSPLSFEFVKTVANTMRDSFHLQPFDSSAGELIKFIGSTEITDRFRNEVDTRGDLRAAVTGDYKIGEELIKPFYYNGPYRGIGYAIDPQPLRAIVAAGGNLSPTVAPFTTSYVPGYGPQDGGSMVLAFVEPEIAVQSTNGYGSRANPAWLNATYEVAFLSFDNSFTRLAPKPYGGESDVKFPDVVGLEMLDWYAGKDRDCNRYGEFGDFAYVISRAYQPEHPEAICSLLYKRCPLLTGLTPC